jgi:cytochrome c-type biogenesis protein CcmH
MLFLLLFTVVALSAVTFVCLPLLRGVPVVADRGFFDRAVYRDQLKEVERDLSRGVLTSAEAGQARLEIQRRLLSVDAASPGRRVWSAPSPGLAGVVALLVLGGAVGLYSRFGSPSLPDAPFAGRPAQRADQTPGAPAAPHLDMQQAAEQLAQELKADPSNAEGWVLYARTQAMLGDYQKAGAAYRHAIDLGQKAPGVWAGYGEMLVLAADGIVSPAAHDAFAQALAADPKWRASTWPWPTARPGKKSGRSIGGSPWLPTFPMIRRCARRSRTALPMPPGRAVSPHHRCRTGQRRRNPMSRPVPPRIRRPPPRRCRKASGKR